MTRRKRAVSARAQIDPFLLRIEEQQAASSSWFVYLFALSDCSAFKVGFSCNPLQRIASFSRRYFERFDLSQSVLLDMHQCELARALEAALKAEFAAYRAEAPTWVPTPAGGHTEWFSAVYFNDAEARLQSIVGAQLTNAFDVFRAELSDVRSSFELWARSEALRVSEEWSFAQRGYAVRERGAGLRDWLDAYRYFDIQLFADEPRILTLVRQSAAGV
jgi:hypothetical protein